MPIEVKINGRTYKCAIGPEPIEAIAREHLGLATLVTRGSDALDFHEHSVASIRAALTAAYNAGKAAR
jgi:hypothetical protein